MVADQHRRARGPVRAQPAAAVGQHDDLGARGGGGAYAVDDRRDAAALVEVGAAEEDQRRCWRRRVTERIVPAWPATAAAGSRAAR